MNEQLLTACFPLLLWLMALLVLLKLRKSAGVVPFSGLFYILLIGIFLIYIPLADAVLGVRTFYGFDMNFNHDINQTIAVTYCLALTGFISGFSLISLWAVKSEWRFFKCILNEKYSHNWLYVFQLIVWIIYLVNIQISGIPITELFNLFNSSEKAILFSASFRFPLLELLAASVPVALFLQFRLGKHKNLIWWLFLFFWLIMSLLGGWRFRIILFVLFLLFHFVDRKIPFRFWLAALLFISVSMSWLTLNRMAIAKRRFDLVTFDLSQFNLALFNNEFSNSRTFRACLSQQGWENFHGIKGWMKTPGTNQPEIIAKSKAWIPPGWPWNPNPALSQPEEFFLLFGYGGLFLSMMVIGIFSGLVDRLRGGWFSDSLRLVVSGLFFQWFSRGYFPFQLKITIICLLPFLLLFLSHAYLPREPHANQTG
jgi:hypothetical protein